MILSKRLYELQQIDLEIHNRQETLEKVNHQLGENEILVKAKAELVAAKKHLEEIARQRRDMEWGVEDLRRSIAQLNEKLYDGKVKNPKELLSLDHELGNFKATMREKEDSLLNLMTEEETTQERIATQNTQLSKLEKEWRKDQKALTQRRSDIENQLLNLHSERKTLVAGIDSEALELYEGLKMKKGQAVVKVEQGRCQGCRLTLPMNEWQRARAGTLVQCSSCSKILYLG